MPLQGTRILHGGESLMNAAAYRIGFDGSTVLQFPIPTRLLVVTCLFDLGVFTFLMTCFFNFIWEFLVQASRMASSSMPRRKAAFCWILVCLFMLSITTQSRQRLQEEEEIEIKTNCSTSTSVQPLLLHVGKAGGGTVRARLRQWKIPIDKCHPRPCPERLASQEKPMLVTIRDPVDRFVSAYRWRKMILCQRDNETRIVSNKAVGNPHDYCRQAKVQEREVLFDTFPTLSSLVLATCQNATTVRQDLHYVQHMDALSAWLPPNATNDMHPLVLEPNYDLDSQVDAILQQWEPQACPPPRQAPTEGQLHSSSSSSSSSSQKHDLLNETGQACLREYLADDYRQLQRLKCSTKLCQQAMDSILQRRGFG